MIDIIIINININISKEIDEDEILFISFSSSFIRIIYFFKKIKKNIYFLAQLIFLSRTIAGKVVEILIAVNRD